MNKNDQTLENEVTQRQYLSISWQSFSIQHYPPVHVFQYSCVTWYLCLVGGDLSSRCADCVTPTTTLAALSFQTNTFHGRGEIHFSRGGKYKSLADLPRLLVPSISLSRLTNLSFHLSSLASSSPKRSTTIILGGIILLSSCCKRIQNGWNMVEENPDLE